MPIDPRDPNLAEQIDKFFDEAPPHEIIGDEDAQRRADRERRERLEGAEEHNRRRREEAAAEDGPHGVRVTPELARQLSGEQSGGMTEFERQMLDLMREQNRHLESLGTLP